MNDNEARRAAWSKLCRPELIGNDGTKLHRIDNFDAGWNAAAEHYKGEMRKMEERLIVAVAELQRLYNRHHEIYTKETLDHILGE